MLATLLATPTSLEWTLSVAMTALRSSTFSLMDFLSGSATIMHESAIQNIPESLCTRAFFRRPLNLIVSERSLVA